MSGGNHDLTSAYRRLAGRDRYDRVGLQFCPRSLAKLQSDPIIPDRQTDRNRTNLSANEFCILREFLTVHHLVLLHSPLHLLTRNTLFVPPKWRLDRDHNE